MPAAATTAGRAKIASASGATTNAAASGPHAASAATRHALSASAAASQTRSARATCVVNPSYPIAAAPPQSTGRPGPIDASASAADASSAPIGTGDPQT